MSRQFRDGRTVGNWTRHHPAAIAIADDLLRCRELLNLRAGRLVRDVMSVRGVGLCTARIAVALARKNAGSAA
jgi:hypothetical protein